jgi:hypothetical protein
LLVNDDCGPPFRVGENKFTRAQELPVMRRSLFLLALCSIATSTMLGCGGGPGGYGGSGPPPPPPSLISFLGTTGVFVAFVDPNSGNYQIAQTGTYAGKKQSLRGSLDFLTGASLSQPAGVEIYKSSDGHVYGLDLASTGSPTPVQLSSESAATIDDTCTLSGTAVAGANYDYVGVFFTGDLQTPTNSSYIYRLPGPDGTCNTADDVIHMVKTGMSSATAPIAVSAMPIAAVRTALGGISGFVIKNGADLVLVDGNFANPVVLGTFSAPINVAVALPVGTTTGYPTGQLYVVDGNIVYVDYVGHTVSASLYTIPKWTPTSPAALYAASPSNLYFAINSAAAAGTPASTSIYVLPANGSASPSIVDTEPGRIATLLFPVQGAGLLWGVVNPTYTIRSLAVAGGSAATLVTSGDNAGTFIATANTVYYETWMGSTDSTTLTVTRSGTQSGIVGVDGTVVQPPLANSTFVNGGEQIAFEPSDTTTTATPYKTVFQVQGLSPVSVVSQSTGYQYTEDGVGGATLVAIDAASNQIVATIGTLPASTATALSGTFRSSVDSGFLESSNPLSTEDPTTRDLYLLNSQSMNSLLRVTQNL